jgi:CBS domain-containing protein
MAKTPIVKKYMKRPARTFHEDEEMAACMSVLARSSFAAIPVVNDDNEVVGLLTEKDVIRTVINWAYDQRAGGSVGNYMSPLEVMVTPEMDLLTAARAFMECNFSCLPVLDGDVLVGRLTRHDVLRGLEKWATDINKERAGRLTKTPDHERPSAIDEIQKVAASHSKEQLSQIFRKN